MVKRYASSQEDPIAKKVGENIRNLRTVQGISLQKMADSLGITFQQVQKYENASNHVSASRLYNIANILNSSVARLFEGVETSTTLKAAEKRHGFEEDVFNKRETTNLIRHYYAIEDEQMRKKILDMIKRFAKES